MGTRERGTRKTGLPALRSKAGLGAGQVKGQRFVGHQIDDVPLRQASKKYFSMAHA